MPRVAGVDIPGDRPTVIALQYIFGVGPKIAEAICEKAGLDRQIRSKELTEDQLSRVASILDSEYVIEGQLRRQIQQHVSRLKISIATAGCVTVAGCRRGQRTKTNARTRKGTRDGRGKKSVKEMR